MYSRGKMFEDVHRSTINLQDGPQSLRLMFATSQNQLVVSDQVLICKVTLHTTSL